MRRHWSVSILNLYACHRHLSYVYLTWICLLIYNNKYLSPCWPSSCKTDLCYLFSKYISHHLYRIFMPIFWYTDICLVNYLSSCRPSSCILYDHQEVDHWWTEEKLLNNKGMVIYKMSTYNFKKPWNSFFYCINQDFDLKSQSWASSSCISLRHGYKHYLLLLERFPLLKIVDS